MWLYRSVYCWRSLSLAHAQNARGQRVFTKWHSGQRIQEIYNQLNLTDDQKKQLEANKQQHRAKMESARQEMKADKEALQEELMKPQLDMSKINGLHNRSRPCNPKWKMISSVRFSRSERY